MANNDVMYIKKIKLNNNEYTVRDEAAHNKIETNLTAIGEVKEKMATVDVDVENLKGNMTNVKTDLASANTKITALENKAHTVTYDSTNEMLNIE